MYSILLALKYYIKFSSLPLLFLSSHFSILFSPSNITFQLFLSSTALLHPSRPQTSHIIFLLQLTLLHPSSLPQTSHIISFLIPVIFFFVLLFALKHHVSSLSFPFLSSSLSYSPSNITFHLFLFCSFLYLLFLL